MATAIVFICDRDYLVPTVGAAAAARVHTADPTVRVVVFLLDEGGEFLKRARKAVAAAGVDLLPAALPALGQVRRETFNPTHVPIAALARLWLDELLDPAIDRFLYLDGDVDITGALDPLLSQAPPSGGLLAAPDLPFLIEGDRGDTAGWTRAYLDGLGLSSGRDYFNSGVLLIDRRGWRSLSTAARDFFFAHPERCPYHDQSALNAVCGRARGELSLRWNYQSDFMAAEDARRWRRPPTIWHFTGFPKAWHAPTFPWGPEFGRCFRAGATILAPAGIAARDPCPSSVADGLRARDSLQRRLTWLYPWRRIKRANRIRTALAACPA